MNGEGLIQIVATIGPASRDVAAALHDAGASAFRLNASHLLLEELEEQADGLRRTLPDCPLIIDLQGAKMRLGMFADHSVRAGERIRFAFSARHAEIPLPHREIFGAITRGETLGCDDDRLRFKVIHASMDGLEAIALVDGILRPRKGVNILEHLVLLSQLTEFDQSCVRAAAVAGKVGFAFSFMSDGREAEWVRRLAPGCAVIGKIERRKATLNIHRIASAADSVWVCRGDLGAQLGPAGMARWISEFDPSSEPCPILMAGQVLEHLTQHTAPTRSEVCHLFDLVSRGYAGFVLSDESAIGVDPVGAVKTLRSLLIEFTR